MITYSDIKKYGKDITVNGKNLLEVIDNMTNITHSIFTSRTIVNIHKSIIKDMYDGVYVGNYYSAFKHIETLKTLNVLT